MKRLAARLAPAFLLTACAGGPSFLTDTLFPGSAPATEEKADRPPPVPATHMFFLSCGIHGKYVETEGSKYRKLIRPELFISQSGDSASLSRDEDGTVTVKNDKGETVLQGAYDWCVFRADSYNAETGEELTAPPHKGVMRAKCTLNGKPLTDMRSRYFFEIDFDDKWVRRGTVKNEHELKKFSPTPKTASCDLGFPPRVP